MSTTIGRQGGKAGQAGAGLLPKGRWPGHRPLVEAQDYSDYDPWNAFLFTAPQAVEDCRAGLLTHLDGAPCSLEEVQWDLETEVMRRGPWTEEELEFWAVLDRLLGAQLIEDTKGYRSNSPHGVVYRLRRAVKIRLAGRTFRLRRGHQLVFQRRMVRERYGLRGPFLTGASSPQADSRLCGEMANAMLGRKRSRRFPVGADATGPPQYPRSSTPGKAVSRLSPADTLWPAEVKQSAWEGTAEPPMLPAGIEVSKDVRTVYLPIHVSGSMQGPRLEAALRALRIFLRTIPTGPQLRVGLRAFNEIVTALQGSLRRGYAVDTRVSLMRWVALLEAGGSTAVFQAVWRALDDLQLLVRENRTPPWYLVVLSDGEDNKDIRSRYQGLTGTEALFGRVAYLRRIGVLEYLPIAYGSDVHALDRIGGPGFRAGVTDPGGIVRRFATIRDHLRLGLPPGGR